MSKNRKTEFNQLPVFSLLKTGFRFSKTEPVSDNSNSGAFWSSVGSNRCSKFRVRSLFWKDREFEVQFWRKISRFGKFEVWFWVEQALLIEDGVRCLCTSYIRKFDVRFSRTNTKFGNFNPAPRSC